MRTLGLLVVIYLLSLTVRAQELVFSEPVKLGSQINSDDEELAPLISSDGKTLYFSRAFHANNMGGRFAGTDIWVSKMDDKGNWMPASNMSARWNNKRSNAVIGVNHDNTIVYLLNAYSNRSGISFSKLSSGIWGEPEFIPIPGINRDDFVGIYVHPDFDVILISMKGADSYGEEDLYVSLKDSFGKWTEPKNLGPTINTFGFEISPFLSLDKKRLFFSSIGHPGMGDADIFYCDRLFDSWETWSAPRNLGEKINSKFFDSYFFLRDSIAFFSSIKLNNKADLYESEVNKKTTVSLSFDRQYLTAKEIGDLIGSSVSRKIIFEKGSANLTSGQKELIYFIANKLLIKTEIKFQLTASGNESKLMKDRLAVIIEQLASVGIGSYRIRLESQTVEENVDSDTIEINFFR